uniref:Uncharacterized protein n=1 Tax=Arion vulgaris TaxID=1028688 RepID=A0A0B7AKN5_9EUPU
MHLQSKCTNHLANAALNNYITGITTHKHHEYKHVFEDRKGLLVGLLICLRA